MEGDCVGGEGFYYLLLVHLAITTAAGEVFDTPGLVEGIEHCNSHIHNSHTHNIQMSLKYNFIYYEHL